MKYQKNIEISDKKFLRLTAIERATFIKEIHKGNFKDSNDPRKKWIEENAKNLNCCFNFVEK